MSPRVFFFTGRAASPSPCAPSAPACPKITQTRPFWPSAHSWFDGIRDKYAVKRWRDHCATCEDAACIEEHGFRLLLSEEDELRLAAAARDRQRPDACATALDVSGLTSVPKVRAKLLELIDVDKDDRTNAETARKDARKRAVDGIAADPYCNGAAAVAAAAAARAARGGGGGGGGGGGP